MVFVPEYRRRLEVDAARVIVETLRSSSTPAPQIVGIFADQTMEDVNHIIGACELTLLSSAVKSP